MIQHLQKSKSSMCMQYVVSLILLHRYLKGLITTFNECVDEFLAKLLPCADRKAQVPMRDEFAAVTLKVVSKVQVYCKDHCSSLKE